MKYNFIQYKGKDKKIKPRARRNPNEKGRWIRNLARDTEILKLFNKGYSNKQISQELNITIEAVYNFFYRESHRGN